MAVAMGYDVRVSVDPEQRQGRSAAKIVPPVLIGGLGGAAICGALLPWGTGTVLFISQTVDGFDLDGEITLSIGVALIAGALAYLALRFDGIIYSLYSLAGGLGILGVIAWQYTKLEDVIIKLGPFTVEITPKVEMEEGMMLTIASGVGVTLISILYLIFSYRDRRAS